MFGSAPGVDSGVRADSFAPHWSFAPTKIGGKLATCPEGTDAAMTLLAPTTRPKGTLIEARKPVPTCTLDYSDGQGSSAASRAFCSVTFRDFARSTPSHEQCKLPF